MIKKPQQKNPLLKRPKRPLKPSSQRLPQRMARPNNLPLKMPVRSQQPKRAKKRRKTRMLKMAALRKKRKKGRLQQRVRLRMVRLRKLLPLQKRKRRRRMRRKLRCSHRARRRLKRRLRGERMRRVSMSFIRTVTLRKHCQIRKSPVETSPSIQSSVCRP